MSIDYVKAKVTEKQAQIFDLLNERIVDPLYSFMNEDIHNRTHISFQEIEENGWPISVVPLDLTKSTTFNDPRPRGEIQQWIKESEAKYYPEFDVKDSDRYRRRPYFHAYDALGCIGEYTGVMTDNQELDDSRGWCGELE